MLNFHHSNRNFRASGRKCLDFGTNTRGTENFQILERTLEFREPCQPKLKISTPAKILFAPMIQTVTCTIPRRATPVCSQLRSPALGSSSGDDALETSAHFQAFPLAPASRGATVKNPTLIL